MISDGKSLYASVMIDDESLYPITEAGFMFTPNEKEEVFQHFNSRTFTQLKMKHLLF